jgi:uncharacterized membrane protein YeaQ/YmgE (transglycosylase-associated protein family)
VAVRVLRRPPDSSNQGRAAIDLLTWLIVGLVGGVLASLVMGGTGYGPVGDIIIGILGAFVGGERTPQTDTSPRK